MRGFSPLGKAIGTMVCGLIVAFAADAAFFPAHRPQIYRIYLIALTWQDLIAGLLAGGAALWAASIAFTAATAQTKAMTDQEEKRQSDAEFSARKRLMHALLVLDQTVAIKEREIPEGGSVSAEISQNWRNIFAPGLEALHEVSGLLPQDVLGGYYWLCTRIQDIRARTGGMSTTALRQEFKLLRKHARILKDKIPDASAMEQALKDEVGTLADGE